MVRSQDGLVVYESPASRTIFGRLLHSGEPSYISDLYVDPEDRRRHLALMREKGSVEGYEVPLRRYDGPTLWVAITASLIEYQGDVMIVAAAHDMTQPHIGRASCRA